MPQQRRANHGRGIHFIEANDPLNRSLSIRLFRIVDWFLTERQRLLSPDELRRHRILVSLPLALVSAGAPLMLLMWILGTDRRAVVVGCSVLLLNAGGLAGIRMGWSSRSTAFVLGGNLNLVIFFLSFYRDGEPLLLSAWSLVNVVIVIYLAGSGLGFGFTAVLLVEVAVGRWAHQAGWVISSSLYPSPELSLAISGATGLVVLATFGWLNELSRHEAYQTMSRALTTKAEGEANLLSLIESTNDFVYSLDRDLRLVAMNSAFENAVVTRLGRGPLLGEGVLDLHEPSVATWWREQYERALGNEHVAVELVQQVSDRARHLDVSINPISGGSLGCTVFARDITSRKEQQAKLLDAQRQMTALSRQAGMAEVATGILHNVGNTLNSVNVSTQLIVERLQRSKVTSLARAVDLLGAHSSDLSPFLTQDPKGKQVPQFLAAVSEHLGAERTELLEEIGRLAKNVDHISAVVAVQQTNARASNPKEELAIREVVEDALTLHGGCVGRLGVTVQRSGDHGRLFHVERHGLLQILVNLIGNAVQALQESQRDDKQLEIAVLEPDPGRLQIQVSDNGIGIAPENMGRMFSQGFTTKKAGHGFGLHMSVMTAKAMGGALSCRSQGVGQGATFILDLPVADGEIQAAA